jgi:hypothetical protein
VYSTWAARTERAHQLTIALYVVNKEKVFELCLDNLHNCDLASNRICR